MIGRIPNRWKLLSGGNNWQNLLNPLDNDLKQYIIHYGAMAQATYDTFDSERLSKYTGRSIYARKDLFTRVGLVNNIPFKYKVVKYIYAASKVSVPEAFIVTSLTSDASLSKSNWIGYVAVATDEGKIALGRRDVLVAWRGTIEPIEWVKDFDAPLVPASEIVGTASGRANVHRGVLSIYTSQDERSSFSKISARDQVLSEVKKQLEKYKEDEVSITVTGHSLGAALTTMNAGDIVANGFNTPISKPCPVTAFAFASPRVGDSHYCDTLTSMNDLHILNIRNVPDIVPSLPPLPYIDVGVVLLVDSRNSPFLKSPGHMIGWHNLEGAYLHALSIANGDVQGHRDLALVNKSLDALKEKHLIPAFWWIEKNKGMVQKGNGSWVLRDHEKDHVEDDDDDLQV